MKDIAKRFLRSLKLFLIAYFVLLVVMYAFQREILYLPSKSYTSPAGMGLSGVDEIKFKTADNLELISWYSKPETGKKTIVFFHGNASNISQRAGLFRKIINRGYGLLALEYRGYSTNPDVPTEEGLYNDARGAIEYLKTQQGIKEKDIILFGRSLGTGVAMQIATEYDVDSVLLISPYDNIPDVAQYLYWYLPAKYLLKDKFDSASKVDLIDEPVFIFHGSVDTIVPIENGKNLFNKIKSRKEFIEMQDYGHYGIDYDFVLDKFQSLR